MLGLCEAGLPPLGPVRKFMGLPRMAAERTRNPTVASTSRSLSSSDVEFLGAGMSNARAKPTSCAREPREFPITRLASS